MLRALLVATALYCACGFGCGDSPAASNPWPHHDSVRNWTAKWLAAKKTRANKVSAQVLQPDGTALPTTSACVHDASLDARIVRLNERFRQGSTHHISSQKSFEEAGVVLRVLDCSCGTPPLKVLRGETGVKPWQLGWTGNGAGADKDADARLSASLVSQKRPGIYPIHSPGDHKSPDSMLVGFVYKSTTMLFDRLMCSYPSDAGSSTVKCNATSPATCRPGCRDTACATNDTENWWPGTTCSYNPADLGEMLKMMEAHVKPKPRGEGHLDIASWNELIFDDRNASHPEQLFPDSLEAVFVARNNVPRPTSNVWAGVSLASPSSLISPADFESRH